MLDELVDAGDNNLPIGPRGSLADMIEHRVGLVGVARAEDCEYLYADGIKAEEEKLADELILDCGGVDVGLLKVEVSTAESNGATLEAGADDGFGYLMGRHCCDVRGAVIC